MLDKFVCAFFYFFRIHLCLKESSKPYSFKSFASLSGQVRAIRTIQFFKEHQDQLSRSLYLFRIFITEARQEFNIAYFFNLSIEVWIFFQTFSEPLLFIAAATEARQEFNIAHFFNLSNAIWNFFHFFWNLSQIIRQKLFRIFAWFVIYTMFCICQVLFFLFFSIFPISFEFRKHRILLR